MEVVIGNLKFKIMFIEEKAQHRDGTEKIDTICNIWCGDQLHGVGRANLNYKDRYNKVVGKRVALTRAMGGENFWYLGPASECKARRTAVWKVFNSRFRGVEENI